MSAPTLPSRSPEHLVPARIRSLSRTAPYAVGAVPAGTIKLISGGPAADALPLADLGVVAQELFADPARGVAALSYGAHAGVPRLREWIARRENAAVERVLVTNGALHGVALTIAALVEPGDVVVVEDPVFPDTVRIAEQFGARVVPVRVGADGLDVDHLADLLAAGERVRVVYTVPDFHNPSGAVLPAAARTRLTELAERYDFVVLSDNPYREYAFDSRAEPDFDRRDERVVQVGTFTKTLGPGLRLGWVIAPTWLVGHLENLRRRSDFHSNLLGQELILPLLERPGWFDDLLGRGRALYGERARVFTGALRNQLPEDIAFTQPRGGFFVWSRLTDPAVPADALIAAAGRHGLQITSGRHFSATGGSDWDRHLRFAFSGAGLDELPVAVDRLAAAFADVRTAPRR